MGNIYKSAVEVIAWTGPAARGSTLQLRALRRLGPKLGVFYGAEQTISSSLDNVTSAMGKARLYMTMMCFILALRALLRRPYWKRLWVCQEVLLAKKIRVFCGPSQCDGMDLAAAGAFYNTIIDALNSWAHYSLEVILVPVGFHSREAEGRTFTFLKAMCLFTNYECVDPRNKVFGLNGLIHPAQSPRVDYSLPATSVYVEAMATICALPHEIDDEHWFFSVAHLYWAQSSPADNDADKQAKEDLGSFVKTYRVHGFDKALPVLMPYLCPAAVERLGALRAAQEAESLVHEVEAQVDAQQLNASQ